MRLWSIHPKYLDTRGLVALWREGLLALKVLQGKTKGYRHHSQLERFRSSRNPIRAIHSYLWAVYEESVIRGHKFDPTKIRKTKISTPIPVTRGQIIYETAHLKRKLWKRDRKRHIIIKKRKQLLPNPIFKIISGGIGPWEKTTATSSS